MKNNYTDKVKQLLSEHTENLNKLAVDFRKEILFPLCKKHDLEFIRSGQYSFDLIKNKPNGDSIFIEKYSEDKEAQKLYKIFNSVLETMEIYIDGEVEFGTLIEDIRESDLKW